VGVYDGIGEVIEGGGDKEDRVREMMAVNKEDEEEDETLTMDDFRALEDHICRGMGGGTAEECPQWAICGMQPLIDRTKAGLERYGYFKEEDFEEMKFLLEGYIEARSCGTCGRAI
jgi:hypothetical protein